MQAKTFFFSFLSGVLALLLALGLFNALIDPIRLFGAPSLDGVNRHKPQWFHGQFIAKPYVVRRQRPDALLLGTSRAGVMLDPGHAAWDGYQPYNFALAGTTALVQWRAFAHASAMRRPRRVLLGLDFFMFNACRAQQDEPAIQEFMQRLVPADGSTHWAYPRRTLVDHASALWTLEGTRRSWRTLQAQPLYLEPESGLLDARADGYWSKGFPAGAQQRRVFRRIERQYMAKDWFPAPGHCFELESTAGQGQLHHLAQLIALAHEQDTELVLYFSPFHARLAEAMDAVGLWETFEALKRQLVELNVQLANRHGGVPFSLWDFSGYNAINTEPVPAPGDRETRMHWYIDGTHGTLALGNAVQDVVFATGAGADFGVRLSPAMLEAHLVQLRQQRDIYRASNPADVAEVQRLADKVSRPAPD